VAVKKRAPRKKPSKMSMGERRRGRKNRHETRTSRESSSRGAFCIGGGWQRRVGDCAKVGENERAVRVTGVGRDSGGVVGREGRREKGRVRTER